MSLRLLVSQPLLRASLRPAVHRAAFLRAIPAAATPIKNARYKSSKAKSSGKSTSELVPGSVQPITDPVSLAEYSSCSTKMAGYVDRFRKECAQLETRASGRVTPSVLDPVRVTIPGEEHKRRLDECATVGVRDGSMLVITVFEEDHVKYVEQGLYDSKLPNIVPQKQDARTIRIPIPKPTVESRNALYQGAHKQAEETRVNVRKAHQSSLKKGKWEKFSIELEEFQKLTDKHVSEIDTILAQLKKATSGQSGKR